MIRTLEKHGDGRALVIDRALMEAMEIDGDTPLRLSAEDRKLVIAPAEEGVGREGMEKVLKELRDDYGPMLRRLAE